MTDKLAAAVEHRRAQRYDDARALLAELYAANPDDAQVNYQYGWLHDSMGDESGAVPYYERAIALGLPDDDLRGALLGLGSTYRTVGQYEKAVDTLRHGMAQFPQAGEFPVFLAMALYNMGDHAQAMALLLNALATSSTDPGIQQYQRAILFYADRLDETWG